MSDKADSLALQCILRPLVKKVDSCVRLIEYAAKWPSDPGQDEPAIRYPDLEEELTRVQPLIEAWPLVAGPLKAFLREIEDEWEPGANAFDPAKLQQWLSETMSPQHRGCELRVPAAKPSDAATGGPVDSLQPQAMQAGAVGKSRAKARKTLEEYNEEARKYLRKHPDAGPRELIKALGCGTGTVYKLTAYQVVDGERKKGRKPKAVSLTKPMADVTGKPDGELEDLIREQERDARTFKIGSRERL